MFQVQIEGLHGKSGREDKTRKRWVNQSPSAFGIQTRNRFTEERLCINSWRPMLSREFYHPVHRKPDW